LIDQQLVVATTNYDWITK